MRAPIRLYRARLGFVFGSRMLMFEHIGRQSGLSRYVVLEVLGHPAPGRYVVASGFGEEAQWFRNVRANPHVRLTVASRLPATATARVLDSAEADAALNAYTAGILARGTPSNRWSKPPSGRPSASARSPCQWSYSTSLSET
ncbi:MAG: nitroreductase family deazaflavin-dependent oxidoreductase, partial [Sciscionella sp.]